jgi:hypothetical protein
MDVIVFRKIIQLVIPVKTHKNVLQTQSYPGIFQTLL